MDLCVEDKGMITSFIILQVIIYSNRGERDIPYTYLCNVEVKFHFLYFHHININTSTEAETYTYEYVEARMYSWFSCKQTSF